MARPTKTKQFAIYDDTVAVHSRGPMPDCSPGWEEEADGVESAHGAEQRGSADEEERRQSASTSTSISSLPDSPFETAYEPRTTHEPYAPCSTRPAFRRTESVRRMHMCSPPSSVRSLRRSVLSSPRAKTPRSAQSRAKPSPRPGPYHEEAGGGGEKKEYPLVLLHITLLPVELPWSHESIRDLVPAPTLDHLQLLRSKVSETIVRRGILIPHPRDEYELLEERLLEALELKTERITKSGHFRPRESAGSASSADSGLGSSVESGDGRLCETCHHRLTPVDAAVSDGGQKWAIKVFAANGLMKAGAWSAGWSEMERVDVEILPWIGDELRRRLDARREEEEDAERRRSQMEDEEARIREAVEEQVRLAHQQKRLEWEWEREHVKQRPPRNALAAAPPTDATSATAQTAHAPNPAHADLPHVSRAKDIPMSLLLRNYIFLLTRDKRNIAVFAMSALAFWLSLRAAVAPSSVDSMAPEFSLPARHNSRYDAVVPELENTPSYLTDALVSPDMHDVNVDADASSASEQMEPPTDDDSLLEDQTPSPAIASSVVPHRSPADTEPPHTAPGRTPLATSARELFRHSRQCPATD